MLLASFLTLVLFFSFAFSRLLPLFLSFSLSLFPSLLLSCTECFWLRFWFSCFYFSFLLLVCFLFFLSFSLSLFSCLLLSCALFASLLFCFPLFSCNAPYGPGPWPAWACSGQTCSSVSPLGTGGGHSVPEPTANPKWAPNGHPRFVRPRTCGPQWAPWSVGFSM